MANSYTGCYIHSIFSTKNRRPLILPDMRPRLWAYIGGIARQHDFTAICVGGDADHSHALIELSKTLTIAKSIQLLKGGSSKWVNDTLHSANFNWQTGYGAFSVSADNLDAAIHYIQHQEEHHRTLTFQDEYLSFLQRYSVKYDERYLWD
jgi:putative transposase